MSTTHILVLYATAFLVTIVIAKIWSLPINWLLETPKKSITPLSGRIVIMIMVSVIILTILGVASIVGVFWWIAIDPISTG